jgi:hypothetical protein
MRIFTPRLQQIVCLLGLATGSAIAADNNAVSIDKSAVKAIEFNLADDNLQQFGFKLSAKTMAERVQANLTEWHYPCRAVGDFWGDYDQPNAVMDSADLVAVVDCALCRCGAARA